MSCSYCGRREGSHDQACPDNTGSLFDKKKMRFWNLGWDEGRVGNKCLSGDPSFILGYDRGIIALESFENGFDHH